VAGFSKSTLVTSEIEHNFAIARAGGGALLGKLDREARWSSAKCCSSSVGPSKSGGARRGLGLLGFSRECVLAGSIRINDVSVDSVDARLVVLDEESRAVDPDRRGTSPRSALRVLARADVS
jgi:hypothetical protein